MIRVFLFLLFFCCSFFSYCQEELVLRFNDETVFKLKKNIPKSFKDSIQLKRYLKDLSLFAIEKGFFLASLEKVNFRKDTAYVEFFLGAKFTKAHLTLSAENKSFLRRIYNIKENLLLNFPFKPNEIADLLRGIQQALEDNGYPFAEVRLDNIQIDQNELDAEIIINTRKQIKWSKIHVKGEKNLNTLFICNLIGFKEGDIYEQSLVDIISSKIKQITYLKEVKPFELLFTPEGVELFLYLANDPVSSANGVIGFQPNPTTNKLSLTGDIDLKLINTINRGEKLRLNWKSIQEQTQSLNTSLNLPFLLKSNFGVDGSFNLYKMDTTFLELKSSVGVQYQLKKGALIQVFYGRNSSNILLKNISNASNLGFVQTNNYGVNYSKLNFDYVPNPRSGIALNFNAAVGERKSRSSDTSELNLSTTYQSSFSFEWVIPLNSRNIFYYSNVTMSYYAPVIYQNEVERFGGQTTQRGFNEQNLFATSRVTNVFEYRYLLDKDSRLFLFFDQTWYENNSYDYYRDTPIGFGAGMTFGTNLGVFSLSYALGKAYENPILFSNGRVHFGYVSYF